MVRSSELQVWQQQIIKIKIRCLKQIGNLRVDGARNLNSLVFLYVVSSTPCR